MSDTPPTEQGTAEAEEESGYQPRAVEVDQPEGHAAPTAHRPRDEDPLDPEGGGGGGETGGPSYEALPGSEGEGAAGAATYGGDA